MSLYGALFSGVSGLRSQSNKIGLISDNISNVNTIGYKSGQGVFQTLVTSASGATAYSPGGVLGANRQLISKQGLLQATDSPTDIAISGSGFFVVNQTADGTGNVLFTRAGSFTQDSLGNFRNTGGFFLQAWPLDRDGLLPGEPGNPNTISSANIQSLVTVNAQNLTGSASATSTVTLSANLNAAQSAFLGASASVKMNNQNAINFGIKSTDIIFPGGVNGVVRGDTFNVTSDGGVNATFAYGGFTFSRSVNDGLDSDLGGGALGNGETTLANDPITTVGGGSGVVTITNVAHGLVTGDVISLSGATGVGDITAGQLTGTFYVTRIDDDTYQITTEGADAGAADTGGGAAVIEDTRPFTGQILDATTVNQTFLGNLPGGTSNFTTAGLSFTITTPSTGTSTFTYTSSTPNAQQGQFNTMTNLVAAINAVTGLAARIDTTTGQLYVSSTNATESIIFANGSVTGTEGPPVQAGIDWVGEFGFADVSTAGAALRFSTMTGLTDLINSVSGLDATLNNPLGTSSITINLGDPLGVITFADDGTGGSLLTELGFLGNIADNTAQSLGPLGPSYDPNDGTKNMASGAITSQFSRQLQVFDALGASHSLTMAFLKLSENTWGVEVFAVPATDVNSPNGMIANGTVAFNGDGTLLSISSTLTDPVSIDWEGSGSDPTTVTFNWGTSGPPGTGSTDGLSQFASPYRVNFVNQNGAPVGDLTSVVIDEEGFIIANYSNGQTQKLYKIPVADFANPDQLSSLTGNVFAQSSESGEVNLSQPGTGGSGKIAAASLEASNVELADQLTDMIVAQRAYQANTKVITTSDSLLEELNRILQ